MVLRKRIFREIKNEAVKYSVLFLIVVMSLVLAIGMGDWTKIIDKTVDESGAESGIESGEFSLFVPLSDRQVKEINDLDIEVEYAPYVDLEASSGGTLRVFKNRRGINRLTPSEGYLPESDGEIFIERNYADIHNISLYSDISIAGKSFNVCGIGTFPDYCSVRKNIGDVQSDYNIFSVCAVTKGAFDELRGKGNPVHNYSYKLYNDADHEDLRDYLAEMDFDENKIDNRYMKMVVADYNLEKNKFYESIDSLDEAVAGLGAGSDSLYRSVLPFADGDLSYIANGLKQLNGGFFALNSGLKEFRESMDDFVDEYLDINWVNLSEFAKAEDNPRIKDCKDDCATAEAMGIIIGLVLFALMAYIMAVFTGHRLERESGIIGVLMASGYKKSELFSLYLAAPLIVTAVGSVLGTVLGFSAAIPLLKSTGELSYYSVPALRMAYSPILLVYGLAMPTLIMLLVNWLTINKALKRTPLSLIRNQAAQQDARPVRLPEMSYINSFRLRRILKEKRIFITMFFGLWISILIVVFGISMYQMLEDYMAEGTNVPYEYMTIFAYPPDKVPKDCEEGYTISLECDFYLTGGTLDVTLMGIKENSYFFQFDLEGNKNELYLSRAAAEKLGYKKNEKIVLTNDLTGRGYIFRIKDIVDYNNTLTAFMSLENIRDKFELEDDEYNTVFSLKKPKVRQGRISGQVFRGQLAESSKVFYDIMLPVTILMVLIGAVIFMLVMYILMGVAIDRAASSVALLKVLGYSEGEISKLYLGGNLYAVIFTIAVSIPTCSRVTNAVFPLCVANVSANIKAVYDIKGVAATIGVAALSYLAVNGVLTHKLKKASLSQALKNRE